MNPIQHGNGPARRPALRWALAASLVLGYASGPAAAATWTEIGDAGLLPATAQVVGMAGGAGGSLTSISGAISSTTDRDLYRIFIDGGGTFSATTVGQPGTLLDSQLFLFDSSGRGVYANDDDPAGVGSSPFRSTLPAGNALTPLTPGLYYLLIAPFGSFPNGLQGLIFPNINDSPANRTAVVGPTGPGGGSPLAFYSGTPAESGTYTIALTGASLALPAPGSLALLLIAAPCLFLYNRWRRRPSRGDGGTR